MSLRSNKGKVIIRNNLPVSANAKRHDFRKPRLLHHNSSVIPSNDIPFESLQSIERLHPYLDTFRNSQNVGMTQEKSNCVKKVRFYHLKHTEAPVAQKDRWKCSQNGGQSSDAVISFLNARNPMTPPDLR